MLIGYLGRLALLLGVVSGLVGWSAPSPVALPLASVATAAMPDSQDDDGIILQITSPRPGERLRGRVEITGYAFDTRSPTAAGISLAQQAPPRCFSGQDPNGLCSSGLNERDIRIWLNAPSDSVTAFDPWNVFDYAVAGEESPEAARRGSQFSNTGFWDAWETCSFPEAPYRLTVLVSSMAVPNTYKTASIDVYVESCGEGQPIIRDAFASQPGGALTQRLTDAGTRGGALDPIFADFAAGVTARCTDPTADCHYGLEFRGLPGPGGTQTDAFYRFTVDPTRGTWTLGYSPPGDVPILPIVDWTRSPVIGQPTAPLRLAVIAQGDWIRVFINGQQVGEARDDRRPWGQIGWVAATSDRDRVVEVQFSNLLVTTTGPAQGLATLFPDDVSTPASGSASLAAPAERANVTRIDGIPVTDARYGFQVAASLHSSDPDTVRLQDGSLGAIWQWNAGEGDCAAISMRSDDFAPYLVLRLGAPFGEQIAEDGSGRQAQIRGPLPRSGTYYLTATSAGEGLQEGNYTLAVERC